MITTTVRTFALSTFKPTAHETTKCILLLLDEIYPKTHTHRATYGVLRFVMESGAKGCEVVVSGKLRAARAKSMKVTDGFMIHSGQPARDYVDYAVRHVYLRQGVLGIKVKM